jgi:hypothetical protein
MQLGASFKLGPFTVDATGGLSPSDPAMAPAFQFRWHDRIVRARLDKAEVETARLILQVTLARVRSSASTPDEMLRPRSFALLRWLERSTPPSWQVALLADHRVWLETATPIVLPITAAGLITEITRFALELAPYLELMDETGLTLPHPDTAIGSVQPASAA